MSGRKDYGPTKNLPEGEPTQTLPTLGISK
jgi:hypothetical protein